MSDINVTIGNDDINVTVGSDDINVTLGEVFIENNNAAWGDITGDIEDQTDLIEYIAENSGGGGSTDGWTATEIQPVFVSVPANIGTIEIPTGVIRFENTDMTGVLSKGMKIRFINNGNTIHGEITAVSFATHTNITYRREFISEQLTNNPITEFHYSMMDNPLNYPDPWVNYAKFQARCTSGSNSHSNGYIIKFNTVIEDTAGTYNNSIDALNPTVAANNPRYYIPVTGIYHIEVKVAVQSPADGERYGTRFSPNGTFSSTDPRSFVNFADSKGAGTLYVTDLGFEREYTAGEYISCNMNMVATKNISPSGAQSFFKGSLVRPT